MERFQLAPQWCPKSLASLIPSSAAAYASLKRPWPVSAVACAHSAIGRMLSSARSRAIVTARVA